MGTGGAHGTGTLWCPPPSPWPLLAPIAATRGCWDLLSIMGLKKLKAVGLNISLLLGK